MKKQTNELEIVQHGRLNYVNMIFNIISYRSPHMHREFELICNFEGSIICNIGADSICLKDGDFLIVNPNQVHEIISDSSDPFTVCLQIAPDFFKTVNNDINQTEFIENHRCYNSSGDSNNIPSLLLELSNAYLTKKENYDLYCSSIIYMIFYELLKTLAHRSMSSLEKRTSFERAERIGHILDYANAHYREKISLADLAREENLSPTYLSRFIKLNLNRSFQEYIGELRLLHAKYLIQSSQKSLTEICAECGYSNYRYFYSDFIKSCGCSPAEYRSSSPGRTAASAYNSGASPVLRTRTYPSSHAASVEQILSDDEALKKLAEIS